MALHGFGGGIGEITSNDGGSITITGTGGAGNSGQGTYAGFYEPNYGVAFLDNAQITGSDGAIVNVIGTGGSNGAAGIATTELPTGTTGTTDSAPVNPVIVTSGALNLTSLFNTTFQTDSAINITDTTISAQGSTIIASGGLNITDPQSIFLGGSETVSGSEFVNIGGTVTVTGSSASLNSTGPVIIQDSTFTLSGGDFSAGGTGFASQTQSTNIGWDDGLDIYSSTINAQGGNISLNGTAGYYQNTAFGNTAISAGAGINIGASTIETSGSGAIDITGVGGIADVNNNPITSATGLVGVEISSPVSPGPGLGSGSVISTQNGQISITGTVNSGVITETNGSDGEAYGIEILGGSTLKATGSDTTDLYAIILDGDARGSVSNSGDDIGVFINGSRNSDGTTTAAQVATISVGTTNNPSTGTGISIMGFGGQENASSDHSGNASGVNLTEGASVIATGSAAISIQGTGGSDANTSGSSRASIFQPINTDRTLSLRAPAPSLSRVLAAWQTRRRA